MRAASYGIRPPNGVVTMYTPFNIHYQPSPSRMLCLLDPLLPIGILIRCLAAYAGVEDEFIPEEIANAIIEKANDKFHITASRKSSLGSSVNSTESGTGQEVSQSSTELNKDEGGLRLVIDNNVEGTTEDPDQFLRTLEMNDSAWSANIDDTDLKLPDSGIAITIANMGCSSAAELNGDVRRGLADEPETITVVDPSLPPGSPALRSKVVHTPIESEETGAGDDKSKSDSPAPNNNHTLPALSKENLTLDLGEEPVVKEGAETPSAYVTSPIRMLREVPIMRNSYMSPLYATDELLMGLPPVHVIVSKAVLGIRVLGYLYYPVPITPKRLHTNFD